jgi:lysophospholipase L1-like esterase
MALAYPHRPARTRRGLAAGLALFVAVVATGCHHEPRVTKPATAVVVGDSLLYLAATDVRSALKEKGWHPVVDARVGSGINGGFTIDKWPPRVRDLVRAAHPDVVFVELGTNGCTGCQSIGAAIDDIMRELRGVPRVYWVNVKDDSPIPANPEAVNVAIDKAPQRWGNLRVLDMNTLFAGHPQWLLSDHIHFNRIGQRKFAELVAGALPDER